MRRTWMVPFILIALASTGCATKEIAPSLHLELSSSDRTPAVDPARPTFTDLPQPKASGVEERDFLFETVIRPLLSFSLRQEATVAYERQRAEGIEAKVDAYNQSLMELQ